MRKFLAAAIVLAVPSVAGAEAPCPSSWSDALVTSFGKQTGSGKIWSIHEPTGLKMLGEKVPYVVIERDTYMWSVWYRLGTQTRADGQPIPDSIGKAFARSYPEGGCSIRGCSLRVPRNAAARWLTYVDTMSQSPPGRDLSGSGAGPVIRDKKLWEHALSPLYLRCSYNTQIPGIEMK